MPFSSDQANRTVLKIMEKYGNSLEYPWKDDKKNAVIRHPYNEKADHYMTIEAAGGACSAVVTAIIKNL